MTLIDKIAWDDTVLPFQLDRADVRGRIARLDGVLSGVLKQHDYPPAVEALVAEMALLTALIGQSIKQHPHQHRAIGAMYLLRHQKNKIE